MNNSDSNRFMLRVIESHLNQKLKTNGHITLFDIRDAFGHMPDELEKRIVMFIDAENLKMELIGE